MRHRRRISGGFLVYKPDLVCLRPDKRRGRMSQRTEKNRETLAGHRCKTAAYLNCRACCFSQYGIHGARLEQVAERAGVSKTNLLYYYPSKEALYVAVMRQIPMSGWRRSRRFAQNFPLWRPSKSISVSSWKFRVIIRRRRGSSVWRCWRARRS